MCAKHRTKLRWLSIWLFMGIVGCGGYDEVSPHAYEYAKALYSITNRKATDRLASVADGLQASLEDGKLTNEESDLLTGIVRQAEDGDWAAANRVARQLMEDQVR